jgi:inosose dehydratase
MSSHQGERPYPFRLGYTTSSWGWTKALDVDGMFATMADAGWEGVELISIPADVLGSPSRVRVLLNAHRLAPVGVLGSLKLGEEAQDSLERQKRLIEYGAELGCSVYCFIGGERIPQRMPDADDFKRLAEASEALIDHAEPLGLAVAYHAHPRCTVESEQEQDRLLSYTDRLGVCVDVSVAAFMQEDPVAQLRKYRDRLAYVHMKDWTHGKFCTLGRGTVGLDVAAVLRTLTELDYSGWVMTELSPYADTGAVESCHENRQYLRSLGY